MVRCGRQPAITRMTIITDICTLDMGCTLIINMAAGAGTGYRLMIRSCRQPTICRMTIITDICTLDMGCTLIINMAANAGPAD